ncbi:MAG: NAD(P)/FAD-dependent oxidoreductase [Bdellovibrionota bacterium]
MHDAVIVGGGAAGLSAALILGRCCRRVLVLDSGMPRNAKSQRMHGFVSRDGIAPLEFIAEARLQLSVYPNVMLVDDTVTSIQKKENYFIVATQSGRVEAAKRVLLATGIVDRIPDLPGFAELFGKSVFHCPYCDGWEVRGTPLGVWGRGHAAAKLAMTLTLWTKDIVVFSNGDPELEASDRAKLEQLQIAVVQNEVQRLVSDGDRLDSVAFADGSRFQRAALFLATGCSDSLHLARSLGCSLNDKGGIITEGHACTSVDGLFAAGDALKEVQFVVIAAAQGAEAALGINLSLLRESLSEHGVDYS